MFLEIFPIFLIIVFRFLITLFTEQFLAKLTRCCDRLPVNPPDVALVGRKRQAERHLERRPGARTFRILQILIVFQRRLDENFSNRLHIVHLAERAVELAAELGLPVPARALGFRGCARFALGRMAGLEDMGRALEVATARKRSAIVVRIRPIKSCQSGNYMTRDEEILACEAAIRRAQLASDADALDRLLDDVAVTLDKRRSPLSGFRIDRRDVQLHGVCARCRDRR